MGWFTGTVLYVLIWWTVLFAVLPFGTKPVVDASETPGGWRGAPSRPRLLMKIGVTTLVSAVIWAGCFAVISSHWLSFRHGWLALPDDWSKNCLEIMQVA
jgi:predicted secreted protein